MISPSEFEELVEFFSSNSQHGAFLPPRFSGKMDPPSSATTSPS
jgi:hypothetical protein